MVDEAQLQVLHVGLGDVLVLTREDERLVQEVLLHDVTLQAVENILCFTDVDLTRRELLGAEEEVHPRAADDGLPPLCELRNAIEVTEQRLPRPVHELGVANARDLAAVQVDADAPAERHPDPSRVEGTRRGQTGP